jgi:hypothetical protein
VDEPRNTDCTHEGNECQFLNATQLFPFVMIADNHVPADKVANLSTYILPEFYTFKITPEGESYTWYDAVPCV